VIASSATSTIAFSVSFVTGFGPDKPLRAERATRTWGLQVDLAVFVQDQLRQVGVETTLKQMGSAIWYPALARRDYTIAAARREVARSTPAGFA
jgi:hypothetical protein